MSDAVIEQPLLTEKQVARMLGVSPFYVRERRMAGQIPCVRLSWRTVRFNRADVLAFVQQRTSTVPAVAPGPEKA